MTGIAKTEPVLYGDLHHWALIHADCLQLLRRFPARSVGAVVTDPPYAIGFGDEAWDSGGLASPLGFQAFSTDWGAEVRRVLKPGGHLVAFGSPRTYHRMVSGLEDAGLEIRDQLLWLHGAGIPKSRLLPGGVSSTLKPAFEPIVLARAPLAEKTLKANIRRFGTGGLNINACRQPYRSAAGQGGYWPSQLLLTHGGGCTATGCVPACAVRSIDETAYSGDEPLSRLFHTSKPPRAEREAGLDELPRSTAPIFSSGKPLAHARANVHPTVKPIDLMAWLIRLVTPDGELVLDPFAGSGSTGCAALAERRHFVGIERGSDYLPIARARIAYWQGKIAAHDGRRPAAEPRLGRAADGA